MIFDTNRNVKGDGVLGSSRKHRLHDGEPLLNKHIKNDTMVVEFNKKNNGIKLDYRNYINNQTVK